MEEGTTTLDAAAAAAEAAISDGWCCCCVKLDLRFAMDSKKIIIINIIIYKFNFGIDFAVQTGSAVFSSQGGLIIFSDFTIDDGNKIIIQHDNGFITVYKHCSSLLKHERDNVVQGEIIGLSGNTGENTTGPHLHFEIWKDGKPQNPKEFFIK